MNHHRTVIRPNITKVLSYVVSSGFKTFCFPFKRNVQRACLHLLVSDTKSRWVTSSTLRPFYSLYQLGGRLGVGPRADLEAELVREKYLMLPGIPIVPSVVGDFTEKKYVWC
jgi:hypothetical protein